MSGGITDTEHYIKNKTTLKLKHISRGCPVSRSKRAVKSVAYWSFGRPGDAESGIDHRIVWIKVDGHGVLADWRICRRGKAACEIGDGRICWTARAWPEDVQTIVANFSGECIDVEGDVGARWRGDGPLTEVVVAIVVGIVGRGNGPRGSRLTDATVLHKWLKEGEKFLNLRCNDKFS